MTVEEQKLLFARRYRENKKDALMIARACLPKDSDAITIINASNEWIHDPIVTAEIQRLDQIPLDKSVINNEVLTIARSTSVDPKDRIAAYKLVAELNGLIIPAAMKGGAKSTDKLEELQKMLEDDDAKDNPNG